MGKINNRHVSQYGQWHYTMDHGKLIEVVGDFEKEARWAATRTVQQLRGNAKYAGIFPNATVSGHRHDSHSYIYLRAEDGCDMGRVEGWAHQHNLLPELKKERRHAFDPLQAEEADQLIREQNWLPVETGYDGKTALVAEIDNPKTVFHIAHRLSHSKPPLLSREDFFLVNKELNDINRYNVKDIIHRVCVRAENTPAFMKKYPPLEAPPAQPSQTERISASRKNGQIERF